MFTVEFDKILKIQILHFISSSRCVVGHQPETIFLISRTFAGHVQRTDFLNFSKFLHLFVAEKAL